MMPLVCENVLPKSRIYSIWEFLFSEKYLLNGFCIIYYILMPTFYEIDHSIRKEKF